MSRLNRLEKAQKALLEAQLRQLTVPFWRQGTELLKIGGAIAALLIVVVTGYFQISSAILTSERDRLQIQVNTMRDRLSYMTTYVADLRRIPESFSREIGTVKATKKWSAQKRSDAYVLLAAFDAGCHRFDSAKANLRAAESLSNNPLELERYFQAVVDLQSQSDQAGIDLRRMEACAE